MAGRYIYRISRPSNLNRVTRRVRVQPEPETETAAEEVPYRDLQAQAKELGIAANQSREELEAAIAEAADD